MLGDIGSTVQYVSSRDLFYVGHEALALTCNRNVSFSLLCIACAALLTSWISADFNTFSASVAGYFLGVVWNLANSPQMRQGFQRRCWQN